MDEDDRRARTHRTIDALHDRMLHHDMAGFAALWAPDGTMQFPFATPESPSRLEGRDAVTAYLEHYNEMLLPRAVVTEIRHNTADPDTVVGEITVAGTVTATGVHYELTYVAVVTVGDAGVLSYRDYWNPAALQAVMGQQDLAESQR